MLLIYGDESKFPDHRRPLNRRPTSTKPDYVMKITETNLLAPKPHARNSNTFLHLSFSRSIRSLRLHKAKNDPNMLYMREMI
jgi:hypothetical protein